MPSINTHIALAHSVTARCLRCGRDRPLDLDGISAAGCGWMDLADLPLRCTGMIAEQAGPQVHPCDGTRFGFTVGARHTGPGR